MLFRACVDNFHPHKNHAYVFLKYALKYAYLIVFMPPPPPPSLHTQHGWPFWSVCFLLVSLFRRKMRIFLYIFFILILGLVLFRGGGGGGGGLSAQNFSAPFENPSPPPPTTGKIISTPLLSRYLLLNTRFIITQ